MIAEPSKRRFFLLTLLAILCCFFGCDSNVEQQLKLAELSQDCLVNSDCSEPLVCAFKACHVQCTASRDCDGGARCLAAAHPYKVCQLDSERQCSGNLDCKEGLVCGVDGACRDGCQTDFNCIAGQVCVSGTCADTDELDAEGHLTPAPGTTTGSEGTPCVYVSDCSAALLCRSQACLPECRADVDCTPGATCQGTRCEASTSSGPKACTYNSECDGQPGMRCTSGACHCACVEDRDCPAGESCDGCACQTDPNPAKTCKYTSECDVSGQICREGACACECKADADCGVDRRCDGCGCVDAREPLNGIVSGDVLIGSSLQLPIYRGVIEILGSLSISNTLFASLGDTFAHLRSVRGGVSLQQNTFSTLDAFPVLETVGQISIQNDANLQSISLPALKTATINLYGLTSLKTLSLPLLEQCDFVTIVNSGITTTLNFPKLRETKSINIQYVPAQTIAFPVLMKADSISIYNVVPAAGSTLEMPLLASAGSVNLTYTTLKTLDSLDPSIHGMLANVSTLNINNNALLSQCAVDNLVKAVKAASPMVQGQMSGNASCTLCSGPTCAD